MPVFVANQADTTMNHDSKDSITGSETGRRQPNRNGNIKVSRTAHSGCSVAATNFEIISHLILEVE